MSDPTPKFDLFLSYNSLDREAVQEIRQQLGQLPQGLTAFLDRENLTLGKRWFEEIESALLNSRAIAVFFGPNGLGRWQNLEMILALDLQAKPNAELLVIPVLLPGADLNKAPRFLLLNSYLELRPGFDSTSLKAADIIVYNDNSKITPKIIIECKMPKRKDEPWQYQ